MQRVPEFVKRSSPEEPTQPLREAPGGPGNQGSCMKGDDVYYEKMDPMIIPSEFCPLMVQQNHI